MERKILKSILGEIIEPIVRETLKGLVEKELANQQPREDAAEIINIISAAKVLHLSKQTIYQNIQTIPHYKINGRLLFKRRELIEYIESNGNPPNRNKE